MKISRPAMARILEVMVLHVSEAMTGICVAACNVLRPDRFAAALDRNRSRDRLELRVENELGANRAVMEKKNYLYLAPSKLRDPVV